MQHTALTVIRNEHAALSAMLRTLVLLLEQHRRQRSLPPFDVLRAMLFYVDEFPERLHHTKESELLFPSCARAACRRARSSTGLTETTRAANAPFAIWNTSWLGFEMMAGTAQLESRREQFEQAVRQYVDFYLDHMRVEESVVLPLAEKVLSVEDWTEVDAAFATNRDPLTGHEPDADYAPLFSRIVAMLPAPLGLGPAA